MRESDQNCASCEILAANVKDGGKQPIVVITLSSKAGVCAMLSESTSDIDPKSSNLGADRELSAAEENSPGSDLLDS